MGWVEYYLSVEPVSRSMNNCCGGFPMLTGTSHKTSPSLDAAGALPVPPSILVSMIVSQRRLGKQKTKERSITVLRFGKIDPGVVLVDNLLEAMRNSEVILLQSLEHFRRAVTRSISVVYKRDGKGTAFIGAVDCRSSQNDGGKGSPQKDHTGHRD